MKTIKDTSTPAVSETAAESTPAAVFETAPAETRDVPPLPGGGSWTFNEATWEWESNAPAAMGDAAAETPSTTKE